MPLRERERVSNAELTELDEIFKNTAEHSIPGERTGEKRDAAAHRELLLKAARFGLLKAEEKPSTGAKRMSSGKPLISSYSFKITPEFKQAIRDHVKSLKG